MPTGFDLDRSGTVGGGNDAQGFGTFEGQYGLHARRVIETHPGSRGAVLAAQAQGGANTGQKSDPFFDTGDFNDVAPGNLRTDYVLPSKGLVPGCAEVFWPVPSDPLSRLTDASDHHLVRVDVVVR